MMKTEPKIIVQRFLEEAYNFGNLAIGDELLTDDCVFYTPAPIEGIASWKSFANGFLTAFPDLTIKIDDLVVEGDKVAARWTANGTHQGLLRGIPASGHEVSWVGIAIYELLDGKIKIVWGLNDALGIMQQIGAIPAKA